MEGRKFERCEYCNNEIYYENATHEQDECVYFDDKYICRNCIENYMMDNYKARLKGNC